EALVRWSAPIRAFTAEEVWKFLPGERAESVMLATGDDGRSERPADGTRKRQDGEQGRAGKEEGNKEREKKREAKAGGGNRQAEGTREA
ncbi:hypothetical protein, partial [Pseudomonas aeruginosa]|uniref:hypothetical protein n=1 Tax=Pseudomonas aeruginosa TaxID=287 RepID=UPI0024BC133B